MDSWILFSFVSDSKYLWFYEHSKNQKKKPVFGAWDSNQPDQLQKLTEISLVASLDMILSYKRITQALIRLRRCAGWSAPLLFVTSQRQVFSRRSPDNKEHFYAELFCLFGSIKAIGSSKSRYDTFLWANNKVADQTARMCRLVCAFVVRNLPKTGFLTSRPR